MWMNFLIGASLGFCGGLIGMGLLLNATRSRRLFPGPRAPFWVLVQDEALQVRRRRAPFISLHEGYAVLLEEVDELWDQVRSKEELRVNARTLEELVQIAQVAQRIAEDLGLVETEVIE